MAAELDLISAESFFGASVRASALKVPFDAWLPLVLDEWHAERAQPLLLGAIAAICTDEPIFDCAKKPADGLDDFNDFRSVNRVAEQAEAEQSGTLSCARSPLETITGLFAAVEFRPEHALTLLPKLMNGTVVALMRQASGEHDELSLHASENALSGYCQMHHLFLHLCHTQPAVRRLVDTRVRKFAAHRSNRVKAVTPDLGELLVLLSVCSDIDWSDLALAFVTETLERNVYWVLSEHHPELAWLEHSMQSTYRMRCTLQSSATSQRLLMFQVAFLRLVRPHRQLTGVLAGYYARLGRPAPLWPLQLQRRCRKIWRGLNTATIDADPFAAWARFFEGVELEVQSPERLTQLLREAVVQSEAKHYHVVRLPMNELRTRRLKADNELFVAIGATVKARAKSGATQIVVNVHRNPFAALRVEGDDDNEDSD